MSQYMKTDKTIVVLFNNGAVKAVNVTNPQAASILDEARKLNGADEAKLLRLFDLAEAMKDYVAQVSAQCNGHEVKAQNGRVTVDGEVLGGPVVDKILACMSQGVDPTPLARFLARLMANPSFNSRQQLYSFLEALNMPITDRGTFLACKYVREDFKDCASGTFDNTPGKVVQMDRSGVDDNPNNTCSRGLHVGAWEYVKGQGARRVLVEVDPADVVSVPTDYNGQKCRCCRYLVLSEILGEPPRGTFRPTEPPKPDYVCPDCGATCDAAIDDVLDNEPDAKTYDCPSCGVTLCMACDKVIKPDDANFCAACGANLAD